MKNFVHETLQPTTGAQPVTGVLAAHPCPGILYGMVSRVVALLILSCALALLAAPARAQCTNCATTSVGTDVVHTFTTVGAGSFIVPSGVGSVRYLIVGGGGGGGGITTGNQRGGGGGGAGGYRTDAAFGVTAGDTHITSVGTGGGGGSNNNPGGSGGDSSLGAISAEGGGGGASTGSGGTSGVAGGSGGGGRLAGTGGAGNTPATVPSQGNGGGNGGGATNTGGGGGGSSGNGGNGAAANGGAGGAGTGNTIVTGASVTYACGGGGGSYGGTGGAGVALCSGTAPNARGNGAGGTANRGGGGSGASGSNSGFGGAQTGGAGSSGIVVIRYSAVGAGWFAVADGNWNGAIWSNVSCAGTASASVVAPPAGSSVTICNGSTVAVNVATANLGTLTVQTNGILNGNNAITVAGATDVSGTINATVNTGTKNFNGATSVLGGGTMTLGASTVNFASTLQIAGTMRCTVNTGTKTYNGAITVQNGGILDFEACTANLNATPTSLTVESGGRVEFTTSNAGTKTIDGLVQIDSGGTWDADNADEGVTFQGGLLVNGTFNAGTGTYLFNTNAQTIGGSTAITIPNITVTGVTLTNQGDLTASTTLAGVGGTLENGDTTNAATLRIGFTGTVGVANLNATQCSATVKNTVEYRFAGTQNIKVPTASYCHLVLTTSGAKTAAGALTVNGDLTMSGSASFNGGTSLTHNFAGNWIVDTSAGTPFAFTTTSFINFNTPATPAQTSIGGTSAATLAFNNVVVNNTSGVAWNENASFSTGTTPILSVSANATLTPAPGVTLTGTGQLTGSGTVQVTRIAATADFATQYNFTTRTLTNLTVEYIGSAAQVVSNVAYSRLAINNASGVSLPGANVTVTTLLTLASGAVTTGANILIVSTATCPASVSRTGGWVAGNLRLSVPGGGASPTCVWHIGDAAGYRPFTIAFTNVGTAGTVTAQVSQAAGEHPNIGTSVFDQSFDVNRYWTVTNATTAFASAVATFTWLGADVDPSADQASFVVGRFNAGWTYLTTAPGVNTASAPITAAQMAAGSSFAVGEQGVTLFSHWRMDQNAWNGTSGEVIDSGTGANHGTAATCDFIGCALSGAAPPKPTTSSVSPAVGSSGVSGTCSYGVFSRANKDHVTLPGTYPKLMNAVGAFTITAWINTTDNLLPGQRIMIDDRGNSSPGGWGFSIGETTTPGGLRFYYRQGAVLLHDTPPIPSNQWLFVAVSVRLVAGPANSTITSYVYNTSGTLVASAGPTSFVWTPGADSGSPSLGGELNGPPSFPAQTEGTSAFGFSGNIDEVRVYQSALNAGQLDRIRTDSRPCASFNHVRIEHDGIGLTCAPEAMTVKACMDATCTSLFNGLVTTTLSPTGWVGGDAAVITGSLTPQLRRTSAGLILLGAGGTSPAPTTGTRCFTGAIETCSFEFKNSGFIFASVPTVTACKPSTTFTIQAVRTDITTQTCAPAFAGDRTITFSTTYLFPAVPSPANHVTLNSALPAGSVLLDAPKNLTLTFNGSAMADLTMTYPDAGQVQLNASFTGAGAEAGLGMTGSTTFVSAPVGVAVVPTGGACVAGDATCAVYRKAGASFDHVVRGACWTADGDTNLADNPVTPNFVLANIPLSANLVAPAVGANATLGASTASISSGGTATVSQTVSETGVFTITATPAANSYFGLTVPGSTSPNIGRFTPNHFTVSANTPSFNAGCVAGNFTYVGQTFNFGTTTPALTVTARNLAGNTTTNYRGAFFKLTNSTLTGRSYTAATGTLDTGGLPPTSTDPAIVDNSTLGIPINGTASLTFSSGSGIAFNRSTPVAPFDADISLAINVIDGDGIVYESPAGSPANPARFGQATAGNGIAFTGGKDMRFGRLRLQATAGSAVVNLRVPLQLQYWNGSTFAQNASDSCTTLAAADIGLSDYRLNLDAGETTVAGAMSFSGGVGTLVLTPPGAGNAGSVLVKPDLGAADRNYLKGAWTGGGWTEDPSARVGFGVYGGQPRNFIFYRENY